MTPLDLRNFPLDGLALIEASAGTGKTYALANLYLRYLLQKQFSVDQILVVTFTEAATQELKDRIRSRIRELCAVFDQQLAPDNQTKIEDETDAFLLELFQSSEHAELDRLRLKIAERQMDQAEIHTIHGFCQQILKTHALEASTPFKQSLIENEKELLTKVIEDFWRQEILSLNEHELVFICSNWSSPEDLLHSLAPLLNRRPDRLIPAIQTGGISAWQKSYAESLTWFKLLKAKTRESAAEIEEIIAKSDLKRLKDKQNWLTKIVNWSLIDDVDFSFPNAGKRKNLFNDFLPDNLLAQTKAKGSPPEHAYFDFLDRHLSGAPAPLTTQFIVQAYPLIQQKIVDEKREQSVFGFDDLILNVSTALKQNEGFAQSVKSRYQVALIDEFQDTDKTQYHIFSTLFGVLSVQNEQTESSRLVLIGDPKQAIYSFRGGDISTYLLAKKDITLHPRGTVFTMDTNWRSSPQMVAAVNALFTGLTNPFKAIDIPFTAVKAANASDDSIDQLAGQTVDKKALQISQVMAEGLNKEQLSFALAQQCVNQVCHVLSGTHIANSDIAILVRSGAEAELIRTHLGDAGLSASYEAKSSIFDTSEALAIYYLLQAVAEPKNEFLLRRCLAEPFFGLKDKQFNQLNEQAHALSVYLQLSDALNKRWQKSGVLAMVRDALKQLKVFSVWQTSTKPENTEWERSLSNINQLAELLQKQSRVFRSHSALVRWLRDSISRAVSADDESRLRLESDEQLIRIVTIHKSKGLEYPYVFIPFLYSGRGADEAWFYSRDKQTQQQNLSLDLLNDEANLALADEERLAEDVRLLYVALTRAKFQCYIGTAAYKGGTKKSLGTAKTAWAYLLFQGAPSSPLKDQEYTECLDTFAQRNADIVSIIHLTDLDQSTNSLPFDKALEHENESLSAELNLPGSYQTSYQAKELQGKISNDWRVQSFTGLMHENHAQSLRPAASFLAASIVSHNDESINIFAFPRGSRAGTFLHTLFESIVFETTEPISKLQAQYGSLKDLIDAKLSLTKLVDDSSVSLWSAYLETWLKTVLAFPLLVPEQSTSELSIKCLADLKEADYFSEMAFYFSVDQFRANEFNATLKQFSGQTETLEFSNFDGHLKGAIDLVFKANGQYFILDYKSNFLGDSVDDYQESALKVVMQEHRYDVQYLLYTLATHRFLTHRFGDAYDYQRDFGGAYYLFLRGLALDSDVQTAVTSMQEAPQSEGTTTLANAINKKTGVLFIKPEYELIAALDRQVSTI